MTQPQWPDALRRPTSAEVQGLLTAFWTDLANLPDLVNREEHLLAARCTDRLRATVVEMMLALNGIAYPQGARSLNIYLGESQRAAVERTLIAPTPWAESWIAQAVALVVIYRWYAPQLVEAFALAYPHELEQEVWQRLLRQIPNWPTSVSTA